MLLVLCVLPGIALAQEARSLLSIFVAYTDLRMRSIERCLEIVASTQEAESGNWNEVQGLLKGYQKSELGIILWYALPSGRYYTVDKGLMAEKLNNKKLFPRPDGGQEYRRLPRHQQEHGKALRSDRSALEEEWKSHRRSGRIDLS